MFKLASAFLVVALVLELVHGQTSLAGGHTKVGDCRNGAYFRGSTRPIPSILRDCSRFCAPNGLPNPSPFAAASVTATVQCCRDHNVTSAAHRGDGDDTTIDCKASRMVQSDNTEGSQHELERECFPHTVTFGEAEDFCSSLNPHRVSANMTTGESEEVEGLELGDWRLCTAEEITAGACTDEKSCGMATGSQPGGEVWTADVCSLEEKAEQYKVEMVWLGGANWIIKFLNQDGAQRTMLLDTAVQVFVDESEYRDQLDNIMTTVDVDNLDYIIIGQAHCDHARGAIEYAERFSARVYSGGPLCDMISPIDATCTRAEPGQRFETIDGLIIEVTPTPQANLNGQESARSFDPFSFRITFPGAGSSIFYSDSFQTFDLDDASEFSGRYLDELHSNIDPSGVTVWLSHWAIEDVQDFDEVNDIINARYFMVHNLPAQDYFSDLSTNRQDYTPFEWMQHDLGTAARPTEFLTTGNFFTTVVLYGADASLVDNSYHDVFKSLVSAAATQTTPEAPLNSGNICD